jgi:putative ABC transport system permease protein
MRAPVNNHRGSGGIRGSIRQIFARFRELTRGRVLSQELDEEMQFHIEMETEQNIRRGMDPVEARRLALVLFGGVARVRADTRELRGFAVAERLLRELRLAFRRLTSQPTFSVASVVTLALGLGVAATMAAFVHAILLRPLPYHEPDRLVMLSHAAPGLGEVETGQSSGTFNHYREGATTLSSIGAWMENDGVTITDGDTPERIRLAMITSNVLPMIGAVPALGRLLVEGDIRTNDRSGILLSHGIWQRRFSGDSGVIGREIEINRRASTIVGVMPENFDFPDAATQLWMAMPMGGTRAGLGDMYYSAIGRLAPGATVELAEAELTRLMMTLPERYPDLTAESLRDAQLRPVVMSLHDARTESVRTPLLLLLGMGLLVLLLTLANVTNLFLVRAERLRREVALSRALGAGPADILRRFLGESIVVATVAGVLAWLLASAAVASHFGFTVDQLPRLHELRADRALGMMVAGGALLSGLVLGAASVLRARGGRIDEVAGSHARATGGRSWQHVQQLLVATQVAVALTLMVGSALMVRSLVELQRVELGFDPKSALTLEVPLPARGYLAYEEAMRFHRAFLEQVRVLPGVVSAELTNNAPLTPTMLAEPVQVEGRTGAADASPVARVSFATPGYFEGMRIPLNSGRTFAAGDAAADAPRVIISASLARSLFAGEDPIGRRIQLREYAGRYPAYEVAGVAADVVASAVKDGPSRTLYFPLLTDQEGAESAAFPSPYVPRTTTMVIRTTVPPTSIAPAIRRIVREQDPHLAVTRVRSYESIVSDSMASARLWLMLLAAGAGASLFLGVIGVYGVVACSVSQRTREIGLRIALGATAGGIERLVLRQGLRIVVVGILAGTVAAFMFTRFLRGILYGVSPGDPFSLLVAVAALLGTAVIATYIPARRASRVDPVASLRAE